MRIKRETLKENSVRLLLHRLLSLVGPFLFVVSAVFVNHADVISRDKLFIPLKCVGSIGCVPLNVNTGGKRCFAECCLVTCRLPITTGGNTVFPGGSGRVNGS